MSSASGKSAVPSQKKAVSRSTVKRMKASSAPAPRNPFSSVTRSAS